MTTDERYKRPWFDKRINQVSKFKDHLIDIINNHKEPDFPWTPQELMTLNYEDIAEIAVATVNKTLSIVLGSKQDYNDRSDTKCAISQYRNNVKVNARTGGSDWMHSYAISGTASKGGALRIVAYNTITKEFEYFFIPAGAFSVSRVEIVIESYRLKQGNTPIFTGRRNCKCKWYKYQCSSFEEMALKVG